MASAPLYYNLDDGCEAFSTLRDSVLPYHVITGHQVHGSAVAIVDRPDLTREELEGIDALVTNKPGVAIGVRTADCVPVLLYDPEKRVVAAVHSGWKGTVRRIAERTIFTMGRQFGCVPSNLKAVIGPAIGPQSFQVGEEVVAHFKDQGFPLEAIWFFNEGEGEYAMHHGHHIDLWKANRWILEQSGVLAENIRTICIDTYTDERFFSARREGIECGRIINAIKLL